MRSWMARRQWIAPLHFDGEAGGDAGTGAADAAAGGGSGAAASGSGATGSGEGQGEQAQPGPVPYARFAQINEENRRLKAEQEERRQAELKAKGEHETLAKEEGAKREAAEARALRIGRRAAFVAAAVGTVVDVEAAATLAISGGMLDTLELDDEGVVTKGDPAKIVDALIAKHAFLKAEEKSRRTGAPLGGAGTNPVDPDKMTSQEQLRAGVDREIAQLPDHRRGVAGAGTGR
jgi:hypothetical protein